MLRHDQVLEHAHAGEETDVLEGARHPGLAGDAESFHALEEVGASVAAVERQSSDTGLVEPGETVEYRRLAGTVGADDGGDVAASRGERDIIDGQQATETHRQMLDAEEGC